MDDINEIIKTQFNKLPKEIQDAILSANWSDVLRVIAKKYQLHIDQTGLLQTETAMVLLGLIHPDDFQNNLIQELKISSLVAKEIVKDINDEIFFKIRSSLKEIYKIEDSSGYDDISKEEVLHGIENPTPTISKMFTSAYSKPSAPSLYQTSPEVEVNRVSVIPPMSQSAGIAEQKISGLTKVLRQETTIPPPVAPISLLTSEPKKYTVDPYRESIG